MDDGMTERERGAIGAAMLQELGEVAFGRPAEPKVFCSSPPPITYRVLWGRRSRSVARIVSPERAEHPSAAKPPVRVRAYGTTEPLPIQPAKNRHARRRALAVSRG
jgi:hypothetical protein